MRFGLVMTAPVTRTPTESALWEQRRRNNLRLGWALGVLAMVLFAMALWKFRPF